MLTDAPGSSTLCTCCGTATAACHPPGTPKHNVWASGSAESGCLQGHHPGRLRGLHQPASQRCHRRATRQPQRRSCLLLCASWTHGRVASTHLGQRHHEGGRPQDHARVVHDFDQHACIMRCTMGHGQRAVNVQLQVNGWRTLGTSTHANGPAVALQDAACWAAVHPLTCVSTAAYAQHALHVHPRMCTSSPCTQTYRSGSSHPRPAGPTAPWPCQHSPGPAP